MLSKIYPPKSIDTYGEITYSLAYDLESYDFI